MHAVQETHRPSHVPIVLMSEAILAALKEKKKDSGVSRQFQELCHEYSSVIYECALIRRDSRENSWDQMAVRPNQCTSPSPHCQSNSIHLCHD